MTNMYVFSRTPELALAYAEDYLKKFFIPEDKIEFQPLGYYDSTSRYITLKHGEYIAIDGRSSNPPVLDCVCNLRRLSVILGVMLEVIFMDLYRVVDAEEMGKLVRSFETDISELEGRG